MVRWVCLGVGINNFASDRVPMRVVIDQLRDLGSVTSYGATGNLVRRWFGYRDGVRLCDGSCGGP
jgi:hypothetical protein